MAKLQHISDITKYFGDFLCESPSGQKSNKIALKIKQNALAPPKIWKFRRKCLSLWRERKKLMSTETMNNVIADYFKTQPVLKAWIFGSYSRGEQRPWSDVDILVQYDRSRPIGLMKIAGMKVDLEDLLHCEVDLVEEGTLRPWAVESVNKDRRLIYERA